MKKFLNIRNVLIVLIVLIAIVYIIFIRSKNANNSKTSNLFYELINKDVVTMNINFKENDKQGRMIFSTNKSSNKACQIIELYDYSNQAEEIKATHIKNITIRENKKLHTYQLNYDLNTYTDFGEVTDNSDITDWIENLNRIVSESKYYTKSYKIINNTKLFNEKFPEQGYEFYYDGNELKYIKQKDGISGDEKTLYEIQISSTFIDESLLQIPDKFTLNN